MKQIILLLSFFSILSCTSPDDTPPVADTVESITGLWRLVSATADGYTFNYVDCNTPIDGELQPIPIYNFKTDLNLEVFSMCQPDLGTMTTTYSFEENVLTMVLNNGVEWKANATALPGNRVKFVFFWNALEGDISNQSYILQRTTMEEVEAGMPPPLELTGTWNLEEIYVNGEFVTTTADCETESFFTFAANNTFTGQQFYFNNDTCESNDYSGAWEQTGVNAYQMNITEGSSIRNVEFVNAGLINMSYEEVVQGETRYVEVLMSKQ